MKALVVQNYYVSQQKVIVVFKSVMVGHHTLQLAGFEGLVAGRFIHKHEHGHKQSHTQTQPETFLFLCLAANTIGRGYRRSQMSAITENRIRNFPHTLAVHCPHCPCRIKVSKSWLYHSYLWQLC